MIAIYEPKPGRLNIVDSASGWSVHDVDAENLLRYCCVYSADRKALLGKDLMKKC